MAGILSRWSSWLPSAGAAFRTLLVARLVSAFCMHISDCDETYNYWEPTHYLLYGSGFQTWEYSPAYAVRSYGYLLIHIIPLVITSTRNKVVVFYLVRVALAAVCALCESFFYRSVLVKFGPQVARCTLLFLVGSCGMFIASTAYLPSSFTMYLCMVAMGAWFQKQYEPAIFAVAFAAIVGWPFSAILGLPIALDLVVSQRRLLLFIVWSAISFAAIAIPLTLIDSLYYGKFVLAPWNIVLYNVFGKGGPNLYGMEPWSYYFVNGFLNFNIVFVLALAAAPLIELEFFLETVMSCVGRGYNTVQFVYNALLSYSGKSSFQVRSKAHRAAVQSMLIWILIFFTRPHKEERFLFPIYPLFCLAAATSLQVLLEIVSLIQRVLKLPHVLKQLTRTFFSTLPLLIVSVHVALSLSRGYALYSAYHAPMRVYKVLSSRATFQDVHYVEEVNLCIGKEWYRFPSSFFLPNSKWKLRFLKSEFKGQLPKPYSPHRNGTSAIPEAMNDMNQEEPSRYFEVSQCHYLVDLDLPTASETQPRYAQDGAQWEVVSRYPFLDTSRSHRLYRAFYIPWVSPNHTTYVDYVLLKNRNKKLFQSSTSTGNHSNSVRS